MTQVAVVIAAYGKKNATHLRRVLSEWTGMQEFTAQVAVVSEPSDPALPMCLPFDCRKILAGQLANLYVFSEDDLLITERNLKAWCEIAPLLGRDEVPGFLRYEVNPTNSERRFPDMHAEFRWQNLQRRGDMIFAEFSNLVTACYVLTPLQLARAIDSGGFLVPMHREAPYGFLECGSADPYLQCGLRRLIPLSRFDEFIVHHLPNNYLTLGKPEADVRAELQGMGVEWR